MTFCFLVTMNFITFGAGNKPVQQLRKRSSNSITMTESTTRILKNSGLSQNSDSYSLKELAYHVSDETSNYVCAGCIVGTCDTLVLLGKSEGCTVVPDVLGLGAISVAGAASFFCLLKAYQQSKSADELFALAQKKNQ